MISDKGLQTFVHSRSSQLAWKQKHPSQEKPVLATSLIPYSELLALRERLGKPNILFPQTPLPPGMLNILANDPIIKKLEYSFHSFSMEPQSIIFIKEIIRSFKPRTILELGSGISTVILSDYLRSIHQGTSEDLNYVTVDQSAEYLNETRKMLQKADLENFVRCVEAPITSYKIEDKALSCYDLREDLLHPALQGCKPELIIIDGPVGGGPTGLPFARMLTAPLLKSLSSPGTIIVMDDAFRDTEIEIMRCFFHFFF